MMGKQRVSQFGDILNRNAYGFEGVKKHSRTNTVFCLGDPWRKCAMRNEVPSMQYLFQRRGRTIITKPFTLFNFKLFSMLQILLFKFQFDWPMGIHIPGKIF